jgi:uncharacterized membrane protein YdjX (TVP38/TMEM64 family)
MNATLQTPAAARWRALAKLAVLVVGLVGGGLLLRAVGVAPGTEWADRHIRGQGLAGEALFVLLGAVLTAVGLPRQGIAFLGGYAFGAALGIALGLLAQVLGAALGFGWARLIGRGWAERRLAGRFGQRLRPLRDAIAEQPFGTTLALRLLPVGNNLALNLLAGMTGIAAAPFLAASALGYLPQTAIFALLGKGVRVDGAWQLVLAAAMLGLSIWLGFRLLRRHRAGRALAP